MLATVDSSVDAPGISTWSKRVQRASGEVFGVPVEQWQNTFRSENDLPTDVPIIMVGHQPELYHPGILAKFIAARRIANEVDGVVVFLVVDHHIGNVGKLDFCVQKNHVAIETTQLVHVDDSISLQDQGRASCITDFEPFTSAIQNAEGKTLALQFANALVHMMQQYAHHLSCQELLL